MQWQSHIVIPSRVIDKKKVIIIVPNVVTVSYGLSADTLFIYTTIIVDIKIGCCPRISRISLPQTVPSRYPGIQINCLVPDTIRTGLNSRHLYTRVH